MRVGSPSPSRQAVTGPGARAPGAARPFTEVLDERGSIAPPATTAPRGDPPAPPAAPARGGVPAGGPLRATLARALGAERQVDALLEAAARGRSFTPGQLLAMQATVARYAQTVEVVSRVADRLVGAIKQTIGTQV
ncbi:MAG TPA: hypothetical protein VKZ18_18505 [Polyangia bacterium]|nr:hypothetical protein [Polyangia bacterium]